MTFQVFLLQRFGVPDGTEYILWATVQNNMTLKHAEDIRWEKKTTLCERVQ